jgi:hypothetical protein
MIEEGRTSAEVGDYLGVDPETVRKFARKRGLLIVHVDQTRENHPSWRGGTTLDRSGYILQRVEAESEFGYLIRAIARRGKAETDRAGYAPVHRIVMHQKLGRVLLPGEVVDHIDGNKTNNDPSNLQLFASNAEHLKVTLKGRCPNWTAEGKARMTGRPKGSRNKPKTP